MDTEPNVLIVDDEVGLADLYAVWLEGDCDVETAYDGEHALELVDQSTDVVVLDRRMPGVSGDDVLAKIRDRGLACRVAMVTGVNADFDVLEMPFDAYLSKPVSKDDLVELVGRLQRRSDYDDALREYFSLASRRATLEAQKLPEELEENAEYSELVSELESLEADLDSLSEQFDEDDADAFLSNL